MSDDPKKIKELGEETQKAKEAWEAFAKTLNQAEKGLDAFNGSAETTSKAMREAARAGEGLGDTFAGLLGMGSGLSKTMANLAEATNNTENLFKGFTKSIGANFNAMSVGVSIVEKMKEATLGLVYATDAALVSFNKQTGAASLYGSKIVEIEKRNSAFGVSIDEVADSQAALVSGIKNFNTFSDDAQLSILETTSVLNELGVESSVTTQSIGFMVNSLGMTTDAAEKTSREMFVLAQTMGLPPQEMASSFNAAAPQLAAFGNQASAVFQKMAVNAKAANMEVEDMLRITEQFDKFDSAASSVGKLNAILGGPYLSTVKMVTTTDPTERLRMMSDAARQAGKSFDTMSYYERKMTASAMGLKDVSELALVMGNQFNLAAPKIQKTQAQIIELQKQTQAFNSIGEEFNQLMRQFAVEIAVPVISVLKTIINQLTYLAQNPLAWTTAGIGVLTGAIITFMVATGGVGAVVTAVITGITGLIIMMKGMYDMIMKSQPALDIFSLVWEKITPQVERLKDMFGKLQSGTGDMQKSFDAFVVDYAPYIGAFFVAFAESVLSIAENVMILAQVYKDSGFFTGLAYLAGGIVAAFGLIALGIAKIIQGLVYLNTVLNPLYHFFYVGNSPSFIEVLGMVGNAFTAIGDAIKHPIQMLAKMLSGLKDVAGVLASKALGFLGGAISYVFGGASPQTEVSNGGFNRQEDMDSKSVSIGEEVARAVKEALQGVQLNNKVELEVTSANGLPTLFDFMQKNMDDVASNRSPNFALNASRAGIGK